MRNGLTLVIPTYNRYPRLLRLLQYLADAGCALPIVVLDSSRDPLPDGELPTRLRSVRHARFDPSLGPIEKQAQGLRLVETPLVVLCADDDLLVPGAVAEAAARLSAQADASAVTGRGVIFTWDGTSPACLPYAQRAIDAPTAAQRLLAYLPRATVLNYAVQRTAMLRAHLDACVEHGFGYTWGELALGALTVIAGRVAQLPRLYLVRESHAGMDSWGPTRTGPRTDVFDWIAGEAFSPQWRAFRDCLAARVSAADRGSIAEAQRVVRAAFIGYVHAVLGQLTREQAGPAARTGWRARLRATPWLRAAWHGARSWLPGDAAAMSLPAMRRPGSRYARDFVPIYDAMMQPLAEASSACAGPAALAAVEAAEAR